MVKMNFMNLPEEYSKPDSEAIIFPIANEGEVTFGKGAAKGAQEIIKASKHLEYYDDEFDCEPFMEGIHTLPLLDVTNEKPQDAIKKIDSERKKIGKRFTLSLGGDHSTTIGLLQGIEEDCSVIILDAHADYFHSWNGSSNNHRCVSMRAVENHQVLQIGIRSMDRDEKEMIEENDRIDMIKAYEYDESILKEKLKRLKTKVYLSIDVDVFDPSFVRNTGTPEPGGFHWLQVIAMLKVIFKEKEVISADIVEFAPKENDDAEAFSLAKLAHKVLAMRQCFGKNSIP